MNTMKKTVAVAAIAALGLTGLAGCGGDVADDGKGHVYYMNNKSEVVDQLQQIADLYTEQTGVEVEIQTAASGSSVLPSAVRSSILPSISGSPGLSSGSGA